MIQCCFKRLSMTFAIALMLGGVAQLQASTITITFNEAGAPAGQLQGTTFYNSYGVSFLSAFLFGPDARLPDDGFGITNDQSPSMTALFTSATPFVTFTWATAGANIDFFAEAYDSSNNLLDSFFQAGGISSTNGVATLTGAGIARVVFHDSGNQIAVDTLTYDNGISAVPVPAGIVLSGIGAICIGGLSWLRHRRVNLT